MTFACNEAFFLPKWVAYYGSQIGTENLFVMDCGTTDLSTVGLGRVNVIRMPRLPLTAERKSTCARHMFAAMLEYYEAGFVVDVDEFVVADPNRYKNLQEFASNTKSDAPACIGLELCHIRDREPGFTGSLPVLFQREHVLFDSSLCKRSFARKPIRFGYDFATSDQPVEFDRGLYLFNLRSFNYQHSLARRHREIASGVADLGSADFLKIAESVELTFDAFDLRISTGSVSHLFDFETEIERCLERTSLTATGEFDFNFLGGFQAEDLRLIPESYQRLL